MKFNISKPAPMPIHFDSDEHCAEWEGQVAKQIVGIQGQKAFWEQNGQQWGVRRGVNSGNGFIEALIPAKLWVLLEHRDPDLLHDDKVWNKFMRGPGRDFKVPLPKTLF